MLEVSLALNGLRILGSPLLDTIIMDHATRSLEQPLIRLVLYIASSSIRLEWKLSWFLTRPREHLGALALGHTAIMTLAQNAESQRRMNYTPWSIRSMNIDYVLSSSGGDILGPLIQPFDLKYAAIARSSTSAI